MLSPLNAGFGAVAIAASVLPLMNPAPKELAEQDRLVAAFERAGAKVEGTTAPPDVVKYLVSFDGCDNRGVLILAGYGRRSAIRDMSDDLGAGKQMFFSGLPLATLAEADLTRAYVVDQLASKSGFRQDGPWSRRLTLFDPPADCGRPATLVMKAEAHPEVRR